MTYCVGIMLDRGMIFASDSRTHAGVDNFAKFCKMTVFERSRDRVLVLLSSGNLAGTQAVISLLKQRGDVEGAPLNIWNARTMFDVANLVADAMRDIERRDGPYLAESDIRFNASFILGGQISGEAMRLFRIYAEGNFIEAGHDTPLPSDRRNEVRKTDPRSRDYALRGTRRRGEMRSGFVRLDHAQQLICRHAHRSDLLRAGQSRNSDAPPLR